MKKKVQTDEKLSVKKMHYQNKIIVQANMGDKKKKQMHASCWCKSVLKYLRIKMCRDK